MLWVSDSKHVFQFPVSLLSNANFAYAMGDVNI
jgi:hypothetical protein